MRTILREHALIVSFDSAYRCISSAVLGGGLGWIRTWLNLQVDPNYDCIDPQEDLRLASVDLEGRVVGMLTAAKVERYTTATTPTAHVIATVGTSSPHCCSVTKWASDRNDRDNQYSCGDQCASRG